MSFVKKFGAKAPTKGNLSTALKALMTMRNKPLSPADVDSIARSYGATPAQVISMAKDAGPGVTQ
jgi:hypothetical protein